MNNARRKQLEELITQLSDLSESLEEIRDEEEECFYRIPENLQGSERYEKAENACDSLQEALDGIEDVISSIQTAQE